MVTNFQKGRVYGVGHIHPSVVTLKAVGMSADDACGGGWSIRCLTSTETIRLFRDGAVGVRSPVSNRCLLWTGGQRVYEYAGGGRGRGAWEPNPQGPSCLLYTSLSPRDA